VGDWVENLGFEAQILYPNPWVWGRNVGASLLQEHEDLSYQGDFSTDIYPQPVCSFPGLVSPSWTKFVFWVLCLILNPKPLPSCASVDSQTGSHWLPSLFAIAWCSHFAKQFPHLPTNFSVTCVLGLCLLEDYVSFHFVSSQIATYWIGQCWINVWK
jgi:hypothetical protein